MKSTIPLIAAYSIYAEGQASHGVFHTKDVSIHPPNLSSREAPPPSGTPAPVGATVPRRRRFRGGSWFAASKASGSPLRGVQDVQRDPKHGEMFSGG